MLFELKRRNLTAQVRFSSNSIKHCILGDRYRMEEHRIDATDLNWKQIVGLSDVPYTISISTLLSIRVNDQPLRTDTSLSEKIPSLLSLA